MLHIVFVAYQKYALLGNVLFQGFIDVVIASIDGWLIWQIKYADAALWTFIVCTSEGSKFLLPCCVPNLQRVGLFVDGGRVRLEVDAHSRKISSVELGLAQSE